MMNGICMFIDNLSFILAIFHPQPTMYVPNPIVDKCPGDRVDCARHMRDTLPMGNVQAST